MVSSSDVIRYFIFLNNRYCWGDNLGLILHFLEFSWKSVNKEVKKQVIV